MLRTRAGITKGGYNISMKTKGKLGGNYTGKSKQSMDKEEQLKPVLFQVVIMVSKMLCTKFLKSKRFKNALNTG